MKDWQILKISGHLWPLIWISLIHIPHTQAVPDPEAYHELSNEEYDTFLRDAPQDYPHKIPEYDIDVARNKRQAGVETYEYNSDETESGPWGDWGQPSLCSRYLCRK